MAKSLKSLLPDSAVITVLEPEQLAGVLLEYLNSLPPQELSQLNRFNFFNIASYGGGPFAEYPQQQRESVATAFLEAWIWLEREGLLIPTVGDVSGNGRAISRRGETLRDSHTFDAYRRSSALPTAQLHPKIARKVFATFVQGDYDTAVFQAFKEIEVAVRDAAKLSAADIGMALMRKAFDKQSGPLTDMSQPEGEREALAHLFAGAIGVLKNPQSHRKVALTEPGEAVEMIMFASWLLRVIDARRRP